MDPLSDVLSLLKPRSYVSGGFDVGGDWSIQFDRHEGIKCYAVMSGEGRLSVEGVPDPVHLKAGDCFLLPRGSPFRLAKDLALTPVDARSIYANARRGSVFTYNGGGDFFIAGSHFILSGDHANILLSVLPPIVHIRKEADKATLRWSMEQMRRELREPQPGGYLVAEHLAHMMLVQALRLHMAEGLKGGVGWLFALADKQVGAAITAMHEDPAHHWTLQALAALAGMSRSSFALKFKETVGASPLDYLTRWRMLLAGDRVVNSRDPVSVIALSLGYESESAFSTAFKRVMGCSPRQYGRGQAAAPAPPNEEQASGARRLELVANF
jgi:AraC-like DNA-binding protein